MGTWTTTAVGPSPDEAEPFKRGIPSDLVMAQSTERPLNWREDVLLKILKVAIANGWQGWKTHVNDAVTMGQEAEGVLRDYRKGQKPIEPLIFDHDFAKSLFGPRWENRLEELVLAQDRIRYLEFLLKGNT